MTITKIIKGRIVLRADMETKKVPAHRSVASEIIPDGGPGRGYTRRRRGRF